MAVVLIIQTGKHKGRKILFPPEGTLLIGRDAECHLRLASTDVSRRHCELSITENGVLVKELGSRNGTFIDGFLISETAPLNPGSILKVGNMEFALPGKRPVTAEQAKPV
ncbi:FHA domain-containing protein, partial [Planctomycetaceae bacterium]|nr:FHA domain-containing protein [Planctomycetaceae bacterium]